MGGDKVPTLLDKWVELFEAGKVEPHPCDSCISRLDFDPEDCDGCSKEMEQITYVPPRLRRRV